MNMRSLRLLFLSAAMCVTLVYGTRVCFADASTDLQKQIDDRKAKITDLQKQIDSLKQSLQAKQTEKLSLQNQLSIIGNRIERTSLDLQATKLRLQTTQLLLQQTELSISEHEQTIATDQKNLGELVRALDSAERRSIMSMFASGHTISDFFVAHEAFQTLDEKVTETVVAVMQEKQALDTQRIHAASIQDDLVQQQGTLQTRHDQLQSQSDAKAQLLLQTKQSEAKFQKLVTDLKTQYSATENEIQSIERQMRNRLQKSKAGIPMGNVALQWPVPSHQVTAYFHDPDYPFRHIFEHPGVDIRSSQGSPVHAAGPGVVARAKDAGMGYSYIIIIHNDHISTLYGHLSKILVSADDVVSAGDTIALSGGTPGTPGAGPFVTGPHLHFEVRLDGIPVNPLDYLP